MTRSRPSDGAPGEPASQDLLRDEDARSLEGDDMPEEKTAAHEILEAAAAQHPELMGASLAVWGQVLAALGPIVAAVAQVASGGAASVPYHVQMHLLGKTIINDGTVKVK